MSYLVVSVVALAILALLGAAFVWGLSAACSLVASFFTPATGRTDPRRSAGS